MFGCWYTVGCHKQTLKFICFNSKVLRKHLENSVGSAELSCRMALRDKMCGRCMGGVAGGRLVTSQGADHRTETRKSPSCLCSCDWFQPIGIPLEMGHVWLVGGPWMHVMGWERTRKSWWCRFSMPVGHPPSFPTSLPAASQCLLLHPARPSPSCTSCTIPEYKKIVSNDKRIVTKTVCPKAVHICLSKRHPCH